MNTLLDALVESILMILKKERQPGPWVPLVAPWWGKWVRWGGSTPPKVPLCSWWLTAVLSGDPNAPPRYEIQRDEEGHVADVIPLGPGVVEGPQVYVVPSRGMVHAWYQGLKVTVKGEWRWADLEFPLIYATRRTPRDHIKAQAAIWLARQEDRCPPDVGVGAKVWLYEWLQDFIRRKAGGDPERVSEIWERLLTRYLPTTHSPGSYVRAACQRAHTTRNMPGVLSDDKRQIPGDQVFIVSPHGSRVGQVAAKVGVSAPALYRYLRANADKLPAECRVVRQIKEGTVTVLREHVRYGAVPVDALGEMAKQLKEQRAAKKDRASRVRELAEMCEVSLRTAQRWLKESAGNKRKLAERVAKAQARKGKLSSRLYDRLLGTARRTCLCGCGRPVPPGRKYATDACKQRVRNGDPYRRALCYLNTQRRRGKLTEEQCRRGHALAKQLRAQYDGYEGLLAAVLKELGRDPRKRIRRWGVTENVTETRREQGEMEGS